MYLFYWWQGRPRLLRRYGEFEHRNRRDPRRSRNSSWGLFLARDAKLQSAQFVELSWTPIFRKCLWRNESTKTLGQHWNDHIVGDWGLGPDIPVQGPGSGEISVMSQTWPSYHLASWNDTILMPRCRGSNQRFSSHVGSRIWFKLIEVTGSGGVQCRPRPRKSLMSSNGTALLRSWRLQWRRWNLCRAIPTLLWIMCGRSLIARPPCWLKRHCCHWPSAIQRSLMQISTIWTPSGCHWCSPRIAHWANDVPEMWWDARATVSGFLTWHSQKHCMWLHVLETALTTPCLFAKGVEDNIRTVWKMIWLSISGKKGHSMFVCMRAANSCATIVLVHKFCGLRTEKLQVES